MSFLAPAFFLGLGALAIPVLVHLIQRERKRVIEFPSLMFLQRIPYQSVRRRRIRHWALLLVRLTALFLMVAAFARPFLGREAVAAGGAAGSREVVILLDQSASMGYGDHWDKARAAARQAVERLGSGDRATLILFARSAEEHVRATPDRAALIAAIDAAKVSSGSTRYGPALKLAQSVLTQSTLPRREAILISDFQRTGWTGAEDARFSDGTTFTPISVGSPTAPNIAVASLRFARATFSGQERITVTAGIMNRSAEPVRGVPVTLDIDGHQIQTVNVDAEANAAASVSFTPFTLSDPGVRGTVHTATDALPQDNAFHFVLTPGRPVPVLLVDQGGDSGQSSLYLSRALSIGVSPSFGVNVVPVSRVTPPEIDKNAVVILNNVPFPPAAANGRLKQFVERGGGLFVILGDRSTWPNTEAALMPGTLGEAVDSPSRSGGTLGFLDYSHPVFEVFKAPRSGDFSGTRVFRRRKLDPSAAGGRVLARFDDGSVAGAEARAGAGRVIVWTSTFDDTWNDLAVKPVFLPLVHQIVRYLGRYETAVAWYTVGQAIDVRDRRGDQVVLGPSGERIPLPTDGGPDFLELEEQGFYEFRASGRGDRASTVAVNTVAVNLDPSESDLSPMDVQELSAAVTGHAGADNAASRAEKPPTPEELERRQAIWWYLLLIGTFLLAAEMAVANRLSRNQRFG